MLPTTLVILIGLLALAVPVAGALGVLGLALSALYSNLPLSLAFGELAWSTSNNLLLVAIPFFVLLGEILLRCGIAERMYNALVLWIPWLPGGLMHSNIAACAMFAATSGSSIATAATIGTVALEQIEKRGYSERLYLGTIAAGGTLGILIPPSINMIIYGVMTETSIPKLYMAGIIPGIALSVMFSLAVLLACLARPEWGGSKTSASWASRIAALPHLLPPLIIFTAVIGSIYLGWATATEAAAIGVLAALSVAAWHRELTLDVLRLAFEGTMRVTAMIMAIILAAYCLNLVITSIGLTARLSEFVTGLGLSPIALLIAVMVFYLVLGMFMETLSMMVATVPIVAPIMFAAGYDPVWFGIVIVVLLEAAMITPPVGINLYVVQGLRKKGKIDDVIIGVIPFIVAMIILLIALALWPQLALWLPGLVT